MYDDVIHRGDVGPAQVLHHIFVLKQLTQRLEDVHIHVGWHFYYDVEIDLVEEIETLPEDGQSFWQRQPQDGSFWVVERSSKFIHVTDDPVVLFAVEFLHILGAFQCTFDLDQHFVGPSNGLSFQLGEW